MNKPYIVCHMMSSLDGRIDCAMTEELGGVDDYYATLDSFHCPSTLSGRVTAEKEMAEGEKFESANKNAVNKETYFKALERKGYEIVADTYGSLCWKDQRKEEKPLLIIMSEKACEEYLLYLKERAISYIVAGKERVDLKRACEILHDEFGIERMAVVGGGHINASFLAEGLLDEVSILIGEGIDGREGEGASFDGLKREKQVTHLRLKKAEALESGAVWLVYKTI